MLLVCNGCVKTPCLSFPSACVRVYCCANWGVVLWYIFSLLLGRFHIFRSVFCYTKLIYQMNYRYSLCKYLHSFYITYLYIYIKKHPTKLWLPCKHYNLGKIMNDCHCQSSIRSFDSGIFGIFPVKAEFKISSSQFESIVYEWYYWLWFYWGIYC